MSTNALTIKQYIDQPEVQKRVEQLLKDRASQFIVTITSMVNADQKYQECDPVSLFTAALNIVGMDLPVNNNLGIAWIIPYKDKKANKTYAQAQFGYKAFIQLALRSQEFKLLNASDVREGEIKGINRLTGEIDFEWEQDQDKRLMKKIVGYVAFLRLRNGFEKMLYMTNAELKEHAKKYSANYRNYGTGMWKDEPDAMSKKTVIKLLLSKYAPISTEMAKIQELDQAVIVDENVKYLDNPKETAADISEEKERKRVLTFIAEAQSLDELMQCKKSCTSDDLQEAYNAKEAELAQMISEQKVDVDEVIKDMEKAVS